MATLQPPLSPQGCTNTRIEGVESEAPLPNPSNKPYLMTKAEYASRFPRLSIRTPSGNEPTRYELKQLVMSGLIRADEYLRDFRWDYKAEVCFDMTHLPPIPFLSSSLVRQPDALDPDRRHSLTPFPAGLTRGLLRRPDVIIVKNRAIRWPGQATADHQGRMHLDNLERVVEVKFPGDLLMGGQREAYLDIAGGPTRFSVLEVRDCRDDGERERDRRTNEQHQPTGHYDPRTWPVPPVVSRPQNGQRPAPLPVPVYGPSPLPEPSRVESWTQRVTEVIDSLLDEAASGIRYLSAEVQRQLEEAITWLSSKGAWIRDQAGNAWEWVSETGAEVFRWTDEQLQAIWREVQYHTDLTIEMLREIDWVQVLINVGVVVGTVVIAVLVAGVLVSAGVPAVIVAGLMVLVRLAQVAWAWLVGLLGTSALVGAAAAS
ncbi:hypothetical protein LCGC14_0443300 [marine sediment metagenome]|uniref:VRR-NUC domain-containing protein n=1 Tax=marine sediment metagenome TaxID=412755 RepID=A0A0F9V6T1_9ZZZZ|nr:VRR-NUC domain-containing protein [Halopseudomonas sabulinigri]